MGNAKISDTNVFVDTITDIKNIDGFAAYSTSSPTGNAAMSGNAIIDSLEANLDLTDFTQFTGSAGQVLTINGSANGLTWSTIPSATTPDIADVLTEGDTSNAGQKIQFTPTVSSGQSGNTRLQASGLISSYSGNFIIQHTQGGTLKISNFNEAGTQEIIIDASDSYVRMDSDVRLQTNDLLDSNTSSGSAGQVLSSKGSGNGTEWITPASGGGGIDFSGVDVSTPADITQSSQAQYGTAITVTAAGNINNGEIVIWDYSNGSVRANTPGSLPGQSEIIGVAIENINSGSTGKVLIYGYATVSGAYQVSGDFLNQTNTINFPTGSNNSPGSTVVTLPTGGDEYITLFDAGGSGSGGGNNQVSSVRVDAGAGNTVIMKIKSFDFEYSTSQGGKLRDRLQIRVGPNANSLSNATLTPGATGSGSTNNNDGWVQMNDFFNSNLVVNGPYSPSEGNVFPKDPGLGGTGPDIDDVFNLGQQVAQFDFVSDISAESNFELQIASSQSQTITNTTAGAGIYLDGTNFEQATNNTSTARYIGAATGSTFANNRFVIFVAPPRV